MLKPICDEHKASHAVTPFPSFVLYITSKLCIVFELVVIKCFTEERQEQDVSHTLFRLLQDLFRQLLKSTKAWSPLVISLEPDRQSVKGRRRSKRNAGVRRQLELKWNLLYL